MEEKPMVHGNNAPAHATAVAEVTIIKHGFHSFTIYIENVYLDIENLFDTPTASFFLYLTIFHFVLHIEKCSNEIIHLQTYTYFFLHRQQA